MHQNTSCTKVILDLLFASQATFAMLTRSDCIHYSTVADTQSVLRTSQFLPGIHIVPIICKVC